MRTRPALQGLCVIGTVRLASSLRPASYRCECPSFVSIGEGTPAKPQHGWKGKRPKSKAPTLESMACPEARLGLMAHVQALPVGSLTLRDSRVHDTPARDGSNHKTIELSSPVNCEDAERIDSALGRG